MRLNRYLVVGSKRHQKPSARLSVKIPALDSHEVAVLVTLEIPDALFQKPQLQASITVPADAVSAPVIEATVMDNIREIASQELGVDLQISMIDAR